MRKTLIPLALALCLTTAHAGRRDGDGELVNQTNLIQQIVASITSALTVDGRKD